MSIEINNTKKRNAPKQILKNAKDILDIKKNLTPYIKEGKNIQVRYNEDYTSCVISATLNTAIDTEFSLTSNNPLANRIISQYVETNDNNITTINGRITSILNQITKLNNNKQNKLTAGANINISNNGEISSSYVNIYNIPSYNTGLRIATSSDRDNNKSLYIPYFTNTQAGVVNKPQLRQAVIDTIQEILPQIAPLFFPQVGEIIETINPDYNPNRVYQDTTWDKMADGIFLESTTNSTKIGTETEAGLPEIYFRGTGGRDQKEWVGDSSASSGNAKNGSRQVTDNLKNSGTGNYAIRYDMKASRSNAIYGKSNTVQPHSIKVFRWIRTA